MAPAEPSTLRYIFGAIIIIAFLAIPFASLRLLAILPPLRPPPRKRQRPSTPTANLFANPATTTPKPSNSSTSTQTTPSGEPDSVDEDAAVQRPDGPTRLLVVLGSGGHTAEMLAMLGKLDPDRFLADWAWRTYVVSAGDGFSAERAREFEESVVERARAGLKGEKDGVSEDRVMDGKEGAVGYEEEMRGKLELLEHRARSYDIRVVPRARRIHQSLLTTPWSALQCLWSCFSILFSPSSSPSRTNSSTSPTHPHYPPTLYPSLILTNGPGTAVIVLLASLLLRFFDIRGANSSGRMRSIYVESWARVKKLSLSGRLICGVVDRFIVQWEGLVERTAGRGEFLGVLV